ncbi:glycosyltransferase [uncultured Bacteroides sp.]|uniref:glycosyltransferase n=1 Tax=uncultured Bacteroides sp. TaxID=162156 RepID=UPI0025AE3222|nr:glycosyltransferase [uncultured Bacteroides sp.]
MKIVFVINCLKVGGAAKMLKYVANIAVGIFDSVSVVDMYDDSYSSKELHHDIKVIGLGLGRVNRFQRQFILVSSLKRCLVEEKPNYVCSFIGHVNVIARLATLGMKNITFISAERGDPFTQTYFWKLITKWAYRKSDYCVFQLEGARDFFDIETRERSFVIPNPFILSDFVEPYKGERNKTIVSAGRFAPEKCYDVLINAFANVNKIHPDYKLILYGEGPLLDDYKQQAQRLHIENKVDFPGYVGSVAATVRKEGIFVLSSYYEGIPNSLIEAMSVGIPCVATNCTPGGPRFLTKNGERGILIPIKDVNAMTTSLLTMIEDKELANHYGEKGLEVIEDLQESKISRMWENAFHYIINKQLS